MTPRRLLQGTIPDTTMPCMCSICREQRQERKSLRIGVRVAIVAAFVFFLFTFKACSFPTAPERIVKIAESQLGKGELYGKDQGPDVEKYTGGKHVAWCAGFVSWVIRKAGEKQRYILSAKDYWESYKSNRTRYPRPGDVICFYRGSPTGRLGHVGIVEQVYEDRIVTIQGNLGHYPAKVKRVTYRLGHIKHLLGFVRIAQGEIDG